MDKEPTYWTPDEQNRFEKYLLDGMDARERRDFESLLLSDTKLNARFLEFKGMFRAIEEEGLRNKMEDFHKKMKNDGKVRPLLPKPYRTLYRVAAAIALLMALGGIWYFMAPSSNERLYTKYFTPDPGLPTVMGNSDNYDFYEAMVDYKKGDYRTAIHKWERLLLQEKDNDTLHYFLGAAHLAHGETGDAIPYFDWVIQRSSSAFQTEAAFYKALAHLKKGEREAARESLGRHPDEKGKKLLKDLNDQ